MLPLQSRSHSEGLPKTETAFFTASANLVARMFKDETIGLFSI
jgi:hypothetical protein